MKRAFALASIALSACASIPAPAPAPAPAPELAPALAPAPAPAPAPTPEASSDAADKPAKTAKGEVLIGEIMAPKEFDPRPTLTKVQPKMVDCFKSGLAKDPSMHGRLKIRFVVLESGKVDTVDDAGKSSFKDAAVTQCVFDAIKSTPFPKPGGTATVTFPLSFY